MQQNDKWLVLFDIDGTLLHSGGCGRAATRLTMREVFGMSGALDVLSFAGKTDWQILRELLEPEGIPAEAIEAKLDHYNDTVARHLEQIIGDFPIQACEGALDVVDALRTHPDTLVGLVTGNMSQIVPIKLRAAGFDPDDFKVGAFGSEGWDRSMLPPLALDRARAFSGWDFAPQRVVIVGDTPGDIQCAASIQARTIAVATGPFTPNQLQAFQPDHVFESMANTSAFLSAIFQNGHRPG